MYDRRIRYFSYEKNDSGFTDEAYGYLGENRIGRFDPVKYTYKRRSESERPSFQNVKLTFYLMLFRSREIQR